MQGCVVGSAKQNVTLREFPKERAVMGAFRIDDSKPLTGSGRVSPMCAVHTSFLLTLLTMSNTMGFAKKQVFSKTAVPIFFQSKLARVVATLTQSIAERRG